MAKSDFFNSATVEEMAKTPHLKWTRYPKDVIPLWIASPDFPVAPEIKEAIIGAVGREDMSYGSDTSTRTVMAEKIRGFNKIAATPDDVMVIQGVDPGIWLAAMHACRPGDEIVVTDPSYAAFLHVVESAKAKPVVWKLSSEDGYRFDEEALKAIVTPRTKLIYVCNPHNPTGRVMTRKELKAVADIAVDKKIRVMVDELWEDVRFDRRAHVSLASLSPEVADLTSTSWGCSKTFGVAGLQVGYLAATNKDAMAAYKKLSTGIARGTSTLSRAAAEVMLSSRLDWWRHDMLAHLHKIRALALKRLNEIPGVEFAKFEGTYVPFCRFRFAKSSKDMNEYLLKEAKVALNSGAGFGPGGEGYQRINTATSEAIMNEAVDRMDAALRKLKPL